MRAAILALALVAAADLAHAIDGEAADDDEPPAKAGRISYKFTPTWYGTTNQPGAFDLNLRGNLGAHVAWVGYYRQPGRFNQARAGYEYTFEFPAGRATPSLQAAGHGFVGASLSGELGGRHFALAGVGRTNLKPYFNLNFDPNDAVLLGAGTRAIRDTVLQLYQIRDDRLRTGQRVLHFVARARPDERSRWTVDIFHKRGRLSAEDEDLRRGTGLSVTYDFGPHFVRAAADPHVNFGREHMLRLALGTRF